jgi:nucleoside-diphosphate-sugar epimerase
MAGTILITGGAGTLGRTLGPMLASEGWTVRLADIRRPEAAGGEVAAVDLRVADDVRRAVDGADAVVHAAAWHGIHLRDHPPRDFWELNVDGTFNVLEAAAEAGVSRFVLSSTMGVYGSSSRPDPDGPAVRVHEALPLRPGDIYGESKVMAERLAAFYEKSRGVRAIALRYGMFVPEPFGHYGVRMLYGGVDERDVAAANVAALRRMEKPGRFAAYNVFSPLPFTDDELEPLRTDPASVVRHHWPDATQLLDLVGAPLWGPINAVYDITRAERELDWRPRYSFETFLAGVRAGISSADDLTREVV